MKILLKLLGVASVLLLSACASIVSDNKSVTYLETTPEVAKCELHGQDFKRVLTTPNSIPLPSEAAPITVVCTAPGYKRGTATLDTKADGWMWGNLIFGGIIGVAVDAAKGSGFKFPPKFSLILEPQQFATLNDRDAWFDRRKSEIESRWSSEISRLQGQCKDTQTSSIGANDGCARNLEEAKQKQKAELDQNELSRKAASVAQVEQAASSPAPAPAPAVLAEQR